MKMNIKIGNVTVNWVSVVLVLVAWGVIMWVSFA